MASTEITWHEDATAATRAIHGAHAAEIWPNCDDAGSYSWCVFPVGKVGVFEAIQADDFEAAKAAAEEALRAAFDGTPYVVTDSTLNEQGAPIGLGQQVKVLGRFPTEQAAAEFIETLPGHADGRYSLDGPPDDW
jgi:hypothetical protein